MYNFFFTKKKAPNNLISDDTQTVMKLKKSICDETQQFKMWWNSKTWIVMNLKQLK